MLRIKNIGGPIQLLVVMGLFLVYYPMILGQSIESTPMQQAQVRILGITQDAGYPQIGCKSSCCEKAWLGTVERRSPVCLGIVDRESQMTWMIEATPDLREQWQNLMVATGWETKGILITHAHVGHYTGLMQLGKEMMNASKMPVMVLPRMAEYLRNNGPWSQLVSEQNIDIRPIVPDSTYQLSVNVSCRALLVPHRDEYSETAAFVVSGPTKNCFLYPISISGTSGEWISCS
ncbi:MAG: hypothetical protein IPL46_04095 [Saprospiraceae bacterium]|nr:hypothetical protein [Saprospiraceae bacterium]